MENNDSEPLASAERAAEQQAKALIMEFEEHYRTVAELHPELEGEREQVFSGWAIQKIAGLQKAVEYLAGNVFALEHRIAHMGEPGEN